MSDCDRDSNCCGRHLQELLHTPDGGRLPHPCLSPEVRVWRLPACSSLLILPNDDSLALRVTVAENMNDKIAHLLPMLQSRTGPAIIYVTLQKQAEEIANNLRPHGLEPMVYHAGLPSDERERIQMQFMESDKGIVCATIAFGMGIDKGE